MTIQALKKKKQELLASQVSNLVSDTNENLLRVNLSKFFTDLEQDIQSALMEYWNDTVLLQGQLNLILSPIHEKHQEYYELIMKHKLQEFHRAEQQGKRLVKRQEQSAMKAAKPVKMTATRNNLFGTLKYSEDKLANDTFKASQNTLNRVDDNINQILTDGYREGNGINDVSRKLTERFDQLRTWEATRIARTEIHTAQNMGVMNSYDQLGVEYTQWIAADDDRTRESHIEVDREIIPIGSTYSNGLAFPGDTSGPIEEWINCRCSNAPFVMPAGMMAPSFSPFREEDLIPIEVEPTQSTPTDDIPPIVSQKLDAFSEEYMSSRQEHMQFFTDTSASEPSHGVNTSVRRSRSQEEFMETQTKKGEEVHGIHTHPNQHDMYTMLSHEDIIDAFIPWSSNLKSFSAENKRNRITIIKTRDDFLKIQQPSKVSSMVTLDATGQVNKAWSHYRDRMSEIRNSPGEELLWKRQRRKELREQGMSGPDISSIVANEAKTKKFKTLEELQDEEFPKIVDEMNEMLTPFGLKLKVKYKD